MENKCATDLLDLLFSWSIDDVFNDELYTHQVERIPQTFQSVHHYFGSFTSPLLEELRAELSSALETISRAPFAEVMSVKKSKPHSAMIYNVAFGYWRRIVNNHDKEPYAPLPGDILVFSQAKSETVEDLQRSGRTWAFGCVMKRTREVEVGASVTQFEVKVSNGFKLEDGMHNFYYASFLINTATYRRTWTALNNLKTSEVIKKVLCIDSEVEELCNLCSKERTQDLEVNANHDVLSQLNESQFKAVTKCLSKLECTHRPYLELIWGPPGTGKTRTLAVLLVELSKLKYRSLTCAPTNVAISEVASRLVGVLRESREIWVGKEVSFFRLGDILLFGNKDRLKVNLNSEMIFLDYRVEKLVECFGSSSAGWRSCFSRMIQFLEGSSSLSEGNRDYVIKQFNQSAMSLKNCVSTICSHVPLRCISEQIFLKMVQLVELLDSFGFSLYQWNELSLRSDGTGSSKFSFDQPTLKILKIECCSALTALQISLNEVNVPKDDLIRQFCLQNASLVLCTASSSYKLQKINVEPFRVLIIDEAAQLKECESVIPLQVPGISHVILLGDECQLPALVRSKVCEEAKFGRSLFERLSLLGRAKHLLNVQYRMHPMISSFPSTKFYDNRIIDAPVVKSKSYRKCYLPGSMFGPLSFINIPAGKEVRNEQGSWKNMVEVAVVTKIVQFLHKACIASHCRVTVGIVAPYSAQTEELQRKLGRKYENQENFSLKIKSIDGCQGGEEDVVILSTVRCTNTRSIDFICSPQRINVSLTRARHCLWILGDERTLMRNRNIWCEFIYDAKGRSCYFNADENKDIETVIWNVKKELNQLDDFLSGDSMLFKSSTWKVLFSDNFKKSFTKLKSVEIKDLVLYLLSKLSSGWRPKRSRIEIPSELLSQILKNYMVKDVCVVCSVDVENVGDIWSQVLKVWDVMPFGDIPKLVKRLEGIFEMYSDVYIECCKVTRIVGNLAVPVTWGPSFKMTRYKSLTHSGEENSLNTDEESTDKNLEDNNWLLMKFYSLSCDTVNHLLSACDGEEISLPFELTHEQKNIIHFNRSTFILSRSGTGKTSVLTMKLVRNEQLYHLASEGYHNKERTLSKTVVSGDELATKRAGLRQLFVTVSPKLCYAVKQEILQLQSFVYGEKSSVENNVTRVDEISESTQFADIPDSFVDLSPDSYPLVITYHKFLMMLNGTIGLTYFERFLEAKLLCYGKTGNLRSVALETFIQRKEVNFDKFASSYWPHFNSNHTRKVGVHVVFTEIMSVIKGGLKTREAHNGLLSLTEYIGLHDRRGSILCERKRVTVYDLFLQYEKLKLARGEFDLADLVIDLHRRFKDERYKGQLMDFVFIDEVQDLSMSQIALFQYICRNVDEGFVFSGDTAQTISQGISFRFEDIRCLFYEQFLLKSKMDGKYMKGLVSDIFTLRENFRTHVGVLKLAQSVIELVYHFFPFSIDKLGPETSPLKGETPVVLESKDGMNAITAIFGKRDNHEKFEGFGAEQVILVRNDYSRKEIVEYVGNRALVLTIMECKGLEFQDVLLYNFFSTSLLEDQWAVIYGYMKDNELFRSSSPTYFPTFSEEKHNLMCSELKQLYVAVTRTRQRLWICENAGFGDPMFSYWKSLGVIQEKKIDSLLVKEMQVVSSREDWKDRGIKLLHENNFERAMLCFERAGNIYWSKYTKASQLRAASAYNSNPDAATSYKLLQEAAEIFQSIGKAEQAAQCFFEAHDYERAGKIYLENCGETKLECAGDCFLQAKCYKKAAEVYARANLFSKCLSSCIYGNLFDMGVQFIEWWKRDVASEKLIEIQSIEQEFLQKVALHFHDLEDILSMLAYVKLFHSMDQIRSFLQHFKYFDEFRLLEEERRGNLIGAASIAGKKGYYSIEIEMFQKAGYLGEASMLILWYIFTDSVLSQTKKGNSCLQFVQKKEFLDKAKSIASKVSDQFYEFVCVESNILSRQKCRGRLFDTELQFIHCWKLKAPKNVKRDFEIEKFEKDLIGRLTYHYYGLRDYQAMMKAVEAYCSTDVIRSSLRSLGRFNELLWFEKNCGNLVEASEVAGEIGHFKEASELILNYVCGKSLWGSLGKGWPLKYFPEKEKYLERAKSFARNQNDNVCVEANILDSRETDISVLNEHFIAARKQGNLRSEILSAWKILDAHLCLMPSKFEYTDHCVTNLTNHSDFMISQNRISADTLIYFWNFWKQKIVMVLDLLSGVGRSMVGSGSSVEEFCLNCMGVYKLGVKRSTLYAVLDSDSEWVRISGCKFIEKNGKVGYISACNFQSAAHGHWSRMLFSFGVEVLKMLTKLNAYSVTTFSSVFLKAMPLAHIFEVSKFLKHYMFHYPTDYRFVNECLALTIGNFIDAVFPVDSRKTLVKSLVVLREREVVKSLIQYAILEKVHARSKLTYEQIGRILMMALSSSGVPNEVFLKIAIYFEENSTWTLFIKEFSVYKLASDVMLVSETGNIYARDVIVVQKFYKALRATYYTNWKSEKDYMSPSSFLFLMERLLFLVSYFNGYFFTSKASFIEWLIFNGWKMNSNTVNHLKLPKDLEDTVDFMADVVYELLLNERDTKEWIRSSESNAGDHFRYFVFRLMVHLCLICLNYGRHFDVLFALLNKMEIISQLPRVFCDAIFRRDCYFVDAIADALTKIGNPLVVVGVGKNFKKVSCFDALFVNLRVESTKDDLMKQLFHNEKDTTNLLSVTEEYGTKYRHLCYTIFWEGFDLLKLEHEKAGNEFNVISIGPKLKVEAEKSSKLLSAVMEFSKLDSFDDSTKLLAGTINMLNDLMDLSSLLDVREELNSNTLKISQILKRLQLRRPRLEPFLNDVFHKFASERQGYGH